MRQGADEGVINQTAEGPQDDDKGIRHKGMTYRRWQNIAEGTGEG